VEKERDRARRKALDGAVARAFRCRCSLMISTQFERPNRIKMIKWQSHTLVSLT